MESGLTRLQDLRLQLRRKDEELARMENLIQTLIRGPEADATELLARLRSSGYFEVPELPWGLCFCRWVHKYYGNRAIPR